jgi:hypothetical protein
VLYAQLGEYDKAEADFKMAEQLDYQTEPSALMRAI